MEKSDDLEGARSIAEEIIRINPASVRHHQKCVEYAFRSNDKPRLLEAYIALADALFRDGQTAQAKKVYMRVLEIAPDEDRASSALEALGPEPEPEAPPARKSRPQTPPKGKRYTATMEVMKSTIEPPAAPKAPEEEFVSLGDWLREDEGPKSTRMVVDEEQPSGDEAADFADMLKKFKQGVAENVEEEDHQSHYDLGVAFKEMGLIDEAIIEFQKALRGPQNRVRTCEALGQCFLEKKQFPMARTVLQRALNEPGTGDDQLVGVLYLLGYTNEALGNFTDAKGFYERVFSVDIQFRDVGERLNAVEKALK
jgi:tetratricopeptide (TPR) repeat protein